MNRIELKQGATVDDLVRSLQGIGASARGRDLDFAGDEVCRSTRGGDRGAMSVPGVNPEVPALIQPGVLQAADATTVSRQAKLADAAEKFEGMMLQELLKPMQEGKGGSFGGFGGGFSTGDDDADRDGSLDTMSSFGTEGGCECDCAARRPGNRERGLAPDWERRRKRCKKVIKY